VATAPPPVPADPFVEALRRLDGVAAARWSTRDVARHYAEITDVVRDYLEAFGVPARERTTSELRWALPPELSRGERRDDFSAVFDVADLVKFAHWRPDVAEADSFTRDARALLEAWRRSGALTAPLDQAGAGR
jgi:hypothetical protein